MPIFEYRCEECNKVFETLTLPGHQHEPKCSGCGGAKLTKLISAPFLPSSVGKPANEGVKCHGCAVDPGKGCPAAAECAPGHCSGRN